MPIEQNQLSRYGIFNYHPKYTYSNDPLKGYDFCIYRGEIFRCVCNETTQSPMVSASCWRLITIVHTKLSGYEEGMITYDLDTKKFYVANRTVPNNVAIPNPDYWDVYDDRFINVHVPSETYVVNTMVYAPDSRDLYISKQYVPEDVAITNTAYWEAFGGRYVTLTSANVAGGYAQLDSDGKIPTDMLSNDIDVTFDASNGKLTIKRLFLADQVIALPFSDLLDRDNPPFYDETDNTLTLTWENGGETTISLIDLVDYNEWYYGTVADKDAKTGMQKNDIFVTSDEINSPIRYRYDGASWVNVCCGKPLKAFASINWNSYNKLAYIGYKEHEQSPVFGRTAYLPEDSTLNSAVFKINVRRYSRNIEEVEHKETLADGTEYRAITYKMPVTGIYKVTMTFGHYGDDLYDTSIGSLECKIVGGSSTRLTQFILRDEDTDVPFMQSYKGIAHKSMTKDDLVMFAIKGVTSGYVRDVNVELELIEQTE